MNYSWRIFKYSKFLKNENDNLSYCKNNIESFSQLIYHSQFDSQGIKKEQWLHIFMESNRFIEILICNGTFIINLNIHNPPNINVIILEKIANFKTMKMCLKGRVLAFKCLSDEKKFQIVFFNGEEASAFFNKFNNLIEINKEDENYTYSLRIKFLSLFKDEKNEENFFQHSKTFEKKEDLIRKFIDLVRN